MENQIERKNEQSKKITFAIDRNTKEIAEKNSKIMVLVLVVD